MVILKYFSIFYYYFKPLSIYCKLVFFNFFFYKILKSTPHYSLSLLTKTTKYMTNIFIFAELSHSQEYIKGTSGQFEISENLRMT